MIMGYHTPTEFLLAADSEINQGNWQAAWELANQGLKQFPNHTELQKYARILAPPKITSSVDRGGHPEIKANRDWLKHNRIEYRGRWVAIKNGELLTSGENLDEIVKQIGEIKNTGILVTPVY